MPFACSNATGKGQEETVAIPVAANEVVYVVVDSRDANELGRFTLDVSVTPSICGDGYFVPGPNEQCDDGNKTNGDGCSATCALESVGNVDVCPGIPLTLTGSGIQQRRGMITFSTVNLNADYSGACGGGSREGVVKVTSPVNGLLRARVRGMPNSTLYARTVCTDPNSEILKKPGLSTCPSVVHDVVTLTVQAGKEYFLFVDGLDTAVGVPTLEVTIDP
jgi:cysteine-rich repeat protein